MSTAATEKIPMSTRQMMETNPQSRLSTLPEIVRPKRRGLVTRFSRDMLHGMHGGKAHLLALIGLLWGCAISGSPVIVGVVYAMRGQWWQAVIVPILIYMAFGLFLGLWPLLMVASFAYGWWHYGIGEGMMNAGFYLALVAVVMAPQWFMTLAAREATKAEQYSGEQEEGNQ